MLCDILHDKVTRSAMSRRAICELSGVSNPTLNACLSGTANLQSYLYVCTALGQRLSWRDLDRQDHGQHLTDLRKAKEWSIREAARRIHVTHPSVRNLETEFTGRVATLDAYLKLLGRTPRLIDIDAGSSQTPRGVTNELERYLADAPVSGTSPVPLFLQGDALEVLQRLPTACIDTIVTSPPYFGHRRYEGGGIGEESRLEDYVRAILKICDQLHRVLWRRGSFWLNLGDTYSNKSMLGVPWRVAHRLADEQGWIIRNDVIWHKPKGGPDNAEDRLINRHEHLFHLTKDVSYFYDTDAIRTPAVPARSRTGDIQTATGITRSTYAETIQGSEHLNPEERTDALRTLDQMLEEVASGELNDFRMILRGDHRPTHADDAERSTRAKTLRDRGFFVLRYDIRGSRPGDVWSISPESSRGRGPHYAPFPEELCRIPILATCPPDGVVLDPFCGSGTTTVVAMGMGRKSIGIDLSKAYIAMAQARCVGDAMSPTNQMQQA